MGNNQSNRNNSTLKYYLLIAAIGFVLSACGKSGSSEPDSASAVVPSLSITNTSVTEGDSGTVTMVFTVSLSASTTSIVGVNYATSNGTATAGPDYQTASGTLQFAAGSTSQTVNVVVEGDTDVEADETLVVTLSAPTNVTIAQSSATGTITNDDFSVPSLSITNTSVTEGDSGTVTMVFTVSLSASTTSIVGVNYATSNGTATAGPDYQTASGTLQFAAGSTSQTVNVVVEGDTDVEADETLVVTLSAPTNAAIAQSSATGTITNDDISVPSLSITNTSVTEGDSGTVTMVFTVSLSASTTSIVGVNYATSNGTATAGPDYQTTSGTLQFAAGSTSQTVNVVVEGDTDVEADETLVVTLSAPTNATIAQSSATGTITNDDISVPSLSITNTSVTEGDSGTVTMVFTVSLSASTTSIIGVNYATSNGTATAGPDYQTTSGTLQFAAGSTSQTVNVVVEGDTDVEADETLVVTLSAPTNATIAQSSATGTITNDDISVVSHGLDNRPDNQTCVAPAQPNRDASVAIIDPFPSLPNISQPTKMILEPVADPRWFVLRKTGQLVTFDPSSATALSTYLDLSGTVRTTFEGGLLGMAFHPDYPATPEIYLSYTIDHTGPAMRSVISRFILDNVTSPGAGTVEQVILQVDQDADNHNGGDIAFGTDGYLYIGLGDGGISGDSNNRAQNTSHLLGAMLRIDVLGPAVSFPGNPYAIPADNPFAANPKCGPGLNANACPEIYAWGFRNPWRWSFDANTDELWLADVGRNSYEEVNTIELGGNYGWRCKEGPDPFNTSGCGSGLIDPVSGYGHSLGSSITGGYVYRGSAIPELAGRYVFADYGSGRFWALEPDGQGGYTNDELIDTNYGPTSFGVDQDGELYFTDINNSRIRMLIPAGPPIPDTIPTLLSNSGCTDPADTTKPYSGLLPYDINALFWSDGADKERYIGLPNGATITRNGDDDWEFPNGTVIVKNFRLNGNLVETRHLMRHPDGVWAGYTYEWNALQTEATRVKGGKTVFTNGQNWIFPSESQCMECHTNAAGFALGPETAQLNKDFTYPSTLRTSNQLETIDHIMMFTTPLPAPAATLPVLTSPSDTGASSAGRARAYLHTNCSQCHRPGGPTPSSMDLRYTTPLASTNACDVIPQLGDLGISNARLMAPGDASRSIIIERASRRDSHGMPPLGSNLVDTYGISVLSAWVNGLSTCN